MNLIVVTSQSVNKKLGALTLMLCLQTSKCQNLIKQLWGGNKQIRVT